MPDIRIEPTPFTDAEPRAETPPEPPEMPVFNKVALALMGTVAAGLLAWAAWNASTLPDDPATLRIRQACESVYPESADAARGCEARLAARAEAHREAVATLIRSLRDDAAETEADSPAH